MWNYFVEPMPPCKSVCLQAKDGCEHLMNSYNESWPAELECDSLPEYERGMCVTPDAIVSLLTQEGKSTHESLFSEYKYFRVEQSG